VKLRFTGEWPPVEYLEQYPNWTNAYDEEGEEGQDETTLKPHEQQAFIDDEVSFTVGDVITAGGKKHLALIEVIRGVPQAVHVFGEESWGLELMYRAKRWASLRQDWVPEEKRVKAVSLHDPELFPLQVVSRLPRVDGGQRIEFRIGMDGSAKEGA
jgi:hypothetical protein